MLGQYPFKWYEGTDSNYGNGTVSNYTVFGTPATPLTSDTFTVEETAGVNGWVGGLAAVQIVAIAPSLTWNGGAGTPGPVDGVDTWNATSGTTNWWNNSTSASAAWGDGSDAIFGVGSGTAGTVTISGTVQPDSITFNAAGSGNYTLSSGTIQLGGTTNITTNVDATIGSVISGTSLKKLGAGTLFLTGSNTYTGGSNIAAGTVNINADAALGDPAGAVTFSGNGTLQVAASNVALPATRGISLGSGATGTLDTQGHTGLTVAGVISGPGNLAVTGGQTVVLTRREHLHGRHHGQRHHALGRQWRQRGLDRRHQRSRALRRREYHLQPCRPGHLRRPITGNGSFTKAGTGTLTINGVQGYTGATLVSDGVLKLAALGGLPPVTYGLVGYWMLNEGTGTTAYDTSGVASPANGTLSNATWTTVAHAGTAGYPPFSTAVALNGTQNGVSMARSRPSARTPATSSVRRVRSRVGSTARICRAIGRNFSVLDPAGARTTATLTLKSATAGTSSPTNTATNRR